MATKVLRTLDVRDALARPVGRIREHLSAPAQLGATPARITGGIYPSIRTKAQELDACGVLIPSQ